MKYAVVRINKNQFIVHEGEELLIDRIKEEDIKPEVLLISNNGKITLGKPIVEKAVLKFKVLEKELQGKKLYVSKYKAKSRYRKKIGFRPQLSKLLIEKIG